jgi:hypothetical protein
VLVQNSLASVGRQPTSFFFFSQGMSQPRKGPHGEL